MNQCIVTLGLVATLSLVSCTQASDTTSSNPVTPAGATASQTTSPSQETNLLSASADAAIQTQESAVSTSGEPAQLQSQQAGSRIDVRAEPSEQSKSLYSGQAGDKGRAFDMTRDRRGQMWYKIRLDSGVEGWIPGQFIEVNYDINSLSQPSVIMTQTWILAKPSNDAPQITQIQGGELVEVSRSERDQHNATWSYIGKGWVANEFLLRPTCIRFNGNPIRVVGVGGATVVQEPQRQAQVNTRLKGGEVFFPVRSLMNDDGTWFEMEKGWVKGEALFTPNCQGQK